MAFTTVVFSYNRGQLLLNCVRSIELFCPESSVVVLDDGSDDEATKAVLAELEARGHEVVVNDRRAEGMHGGLYANMNRALELARARGWTLLHLVQEDMQLVRHDPGLPAELDRLFRELPEACQVTTHFWKTLSRSSSTYLPEHGVYKAGRAICDVGVVHVERLVDAGFEFGPTEHEAADRARRLGFWSYALPQPVVARVPWPTNFKFGAHTGGSDRITTAPLLMKPLDAAALHRLASQATSGPAYGEDYVTPWGWRCWSPYPTRPSRSRWVRGLIALTARGYGSKRLIPRRVGDMNVSPQAVDAALPGSPRPL